jgi:ABC-type nitrate/sulfonate/bicarbonate transport system permease component
VTESKPAPGIERLRLPVGVASVAVLLALWQAASALTTAGRLTGSPLSIVRAVPGVVGDGLVADGLYSLGALAWGMAIAIVVGIGLGVLLGWFKRLSYLLEPMLMAFYVTPTVALLPLIVIFAGVGNRSTTLVVVLSAVFPILLNTIAGVRQLDPMWLRAVQAYGGDRWWAFRLVALRGSLPEIVLGIRLGIGRGLIGVIVAEMYASTEGIGSLLSAYSHAVRISQSFVVVIAIGIVGYALVQGMRILEERVSRWRR